MNFQPKRDLHCLFVPDEEIGGLRGMKPFLEMKEFKNLNVGFVFDEGKTKKRIRTDFLRHFSLDDQV